jgi:arginyl-tRNA synthetase
MSLRELTVHAIADASSLGADEVKNLLEVPPDPKMGDLALPCFTLAKKLRKSPAEIASLAAERFVLPEGVASARAVGPYLNVSFDPGAYASEVLGDISREGDRYGCSDNGDGRTVVVDYSSPNIAKTFHIGHLRSTSIGNALANLYRANGWKVVRVNHLGDWGTQFGNLFIAHSKWGEKPASETSVSEFVRLYVRFHAEADNDPALAAEGREAFRRLETGDEEVQHFWQAAVASSWSEFERIYERLGVTFDGWTGESFYTPFLPTILSDLEEYGIAEVDEGALIVRLEEEDLPPVLLRKSDGATLYATRELAAIHYRKKFYSFDRCLYVTGAPQTDHFRGVFGVLRRIGRPWADQCAHVAFGHMRFADGAMSTRHGKVVSLSDVLDRAVELAEKAVAEKNPTLSDRSAVAEKVGVGAVVFAQFTSRRIKDVVFDWDRVLSFDGGSGPYLQYTHARSDSILRKAPNGLDPAGADPRLLVEPEATGVVRALGSWPGAVRTGLSQDEPAVLAEALLSIASAFNTFYNAHRVLGDDKAVSGARLALVRAVRDVVRSGLGILGLSAPEEM